MLRRAITICLALLGAPALAQDLQGNDTAGNWRVTAYESFGLWTSICDEREEAGALVQRCYVRWVDVFSAAPKFGALFLFITPEAEGELVDFGLEPGTLFAPGNFRIERAGETRWSTNRLGCLTGLSCAFSGEDARALLAAMVAGGEFRFTFRDRHGQSQDLSWPLEGFAAALADFRARAAERGLPKAG